MRKLGMGCLILIIATVIGFVATFLILKAVRNDRIEKEVDSIVQVLGDAASEGSAEQKGARDATQATVDLEKTIRLFHILDAGYEQAGDMQEYLQFLAKQDYRGIPAEVIDAKKKLIPYYKSLRQAEEALDEAGRHKLWKSITENEKGT